MINIYELPDGSAVDLNQVLQVGPLFVNKNDSQHNSYEIFLSNGTRVGVFERELSRAVFLAVWKG